MAATYDQSTDIGRVRLAIADTDVARPDFSDEEIQTALTLEGGVKLASAFLLNALAANRARLAVRVQRGGVARGGVSEDLTEVAEQLRAQADRYRAEGELEESSSAALEATISPSWERFSYTKNVVLDREDEITT